MDILHALLISIETYIAWVLPSMVWLSAWRPFSFINNQIINKSLGYLYPVMHFFGNTTSCLLLTLVSCTPGAVLQYPLKTTLKLKFQVCLLFQKRENIISYCYGLISIYMICRQRKTQSFNTWFISKTISSNYIIICTYIWVMKKLISWLGLVTLVLITGIAIRYPIMLKSLLLSCFMMTSSNGNIFRVTGPLCGEFTGRRWIPRTKAHDAELSCFLWSAPE